MKRLSRAITSIQLTVIFLFVLCLQVRGEENQVAAVKVLLSPEEKQWLMQHPEIRISVRENPPLMMRSEKEGSFRGLTIDYMNLLAQRLGIKFKLVFFRTQKDQLEGAKKRETDVMAAAVWASERLAWFNFTPPYVIVENKIIARRGMFDGSTTLENLRGKRVAVVDGAAIQSYLKKERDYFTVEAVRDEPTALVEASFGTVDAAIMDLGRATYYIEKEKISNLDIVGNADYTYEFCFASRNDWPLLNHILAVGLASISNEEREAITRKWIYPQAPSILKSKTFWISAIGASMALFTIIILLWNWTLRRKVVHTTAELTVINEQLRQAQKMEAIGQLAGGVAHDFNNILSAIVGYSHMTLMKMGDDDPNRHHIEQVLASTDRATVLTQSLLAFSRKQTVNLTRIDLNDVVARFERFLLRLLREDIAFKTTLGDQELPMMADRGQIEQMLMNLVTNARDAMPKGGRIVVETSLVKFNRSSAEAHDVGQAGEYALFSITDTGEGIPEHIRNKIFDPFFTTKEAGKGTGLGLSMVYGIVKKHEGYINVQSKPGVGTTFRIYLPIARISVEAKEQKTEEAPPRGGTETVLLAEDDAIVRAMNAGVLRHYGYAVIEAEDGLEAIAKFKESRDSIHLVLLDGIMPRMNGKDAWQEIRKLRPGIKVIFISGYAEDIFAKDGVQDSSAVLLQKPAAPSVLLKKIREVLDA